MQADQHTILMFDRHRHNLAHWNACDRAVLDGHRKHLQQLITMTRLRGIQHRSPLLNRLRHIRIRRQRTAQPRLRLWTKPLRQRNHTLLPHCTIGLRYRMVLRNLRCRILLRSRHQPHRQRSHNKVQFHQSGLRQQILQVMQRSVHRYRSGFLSGAPFMQRRSGIIRVKFEPPLQPQPGLLRPHC